MARGTGGTHPGERVHPYYTGPLELTWLIHPYVNLVVTGRFTGASGTPKVGQSINLFHCLLHILTEGWPIIFSPVKAPYTPRWMSEFSYRCDIRKGGTWNIWFKVSFHSGIPFGNRIIFARPSLKISDLNYAYSLLRYNSKLLFIWPDLQDQVLSPLHTTFHPLSYNTI